MEHNIESVKYIGPALMRRLSERGILSVAQLAGMTLIELTAVPGVGANMAPRILASARELLETPVVEVAAKPAKVRAPRKPAVKKVEVAVEEAPPVTTATAVTPSEKPAKEPLKESEKKTKKAEKRSRKKLKKQLKKQMKKEKKQDKKAEKLAKKAVKKAAQKAAK